MPTIDPYRLALLTHHVCFSSEEASSPLPLTSIIRDKERSPSVKSACLADMSVALKILSVTAPQLLPANPLLVAETQADAHTTHYHAP